MKNLLKWVLLLLVSASSAFAQVKVEVSFDQEQFLPNEVMIAKVRILNNAGQTLVLGNDFEWLSITVESPKFGIINQTMPLEQVGEISLPSAYRATRKVDLSKSFELSRLGRYTIIAEVSIPEWGGLYTSAPRNFDISPGTTLKEIPFGVPGEDPQGRPEFRKYLLLQANHMKDNRLYVRITDLQEDHTFKMFPLGSLISFSKPEAQLDTWNNLHVLFQTGAKSFRFTSISPDGTLMTRQNHEYHGNSRPVLGVAENGAVRVKGGIQRVTGTDLPPPDFNQPKSTVEVVTPPAPAAPLKATEDDKPTDAKRSKKN
ncbi:MAG: hypothetical protein ACO1QB_09695 [Verrucomicrobiales bacterium]